MTEILSCLQSILEHQNCPNAKNILPLNNWVRICFKAKKEKILFSSIVNYV
jgi:hypothetical protein